MNVPVINGFIFIERGREMEGEGGREGVGCHCYARVTCMHQYLTTDKQTNNTAAFILSSVQLCLRG